jgi:hypothetical protein
MSGEPPPGMGQVAIGRPKAKEMTETDPAPRLETYNTFESRLT